MAVDEQVEQNAQILVASGKAVICNLARVPRLRSAAEIYLGNQTQKAPRPFLLPPSTNAFGMESLAKPL